MIDSFQIGTIVEWRSNPCRIIKGTIISAPYYNKYDILVYDIIVSENNIENKYSIHHEMYGLTFRVN